MKLASCLKSAFIVLGLVSIAFGEEKPKTEKPATEKPATEKPKPRSTEIAPGFQEAIKALTAEFEPAIKDANTAFRDKSDYYAKSTETFDQDQILTVLGKRLNKDPRVDAYIKWQLISAQNGLFDDAHGKEAAKLYAKVPPLDERPGVSPGEQAQLVNSIKGIKPDQIDQYNVKWKEHVANFTKLNAPILGYRDELYARLPRTYETFRMAYEDAMDRINKGYDAGPFIKRINNDLRAVAAGLKPVEIGRLAQLVQNYGGKTGATVSTEIINDEKAKAIKWKTQALAINKKDADALYKDLVEMSKAGF